MPIKGQPRQVHVFDLSTEEVQEFLENPAAEKFQVASDPEEGRASSPEQDKPSHLLIDNNVDAD